MARVNYGTEIRNKVKHLYVREGKSANQIFNELGEPTAVTILAWAKVKDDGGKTWDDLKEDYMKDSFSDLCQAIEPHKIVLLHIKQIAALLNKDPKNFDPKDSDAIAKLQSSMQKIGGKDLWIPAMYEALGEFIKFLKTNYTEIVSDELLNAARHFKNVIIERLTQDSGLVQVYVKNPFGTRSNAPVSNQPGG